MRITVIGVGPTGPPVVNEPVDDPTDAELDGDPAVPVQ